MKGSSAEELGRGYLFLGVGTRMLLGIDLAGSVDV
jgi:hypothetical protein